MRPRFNRRLAHFSAPFPLRSMRIAGKDKRIASPLSQEGQTLEFALTPLPPLAGMGSASAIGQGVGGGGKFLPEKQLVPMPQDALQQADTNQCKDHVAAAR